MVIASRKGKNLLTHFRFFLASYSCEISAVYHIELTRGFLICIRDSISWTIIAAIVHHKFVACQQALCPSRESILILKRPHCETCFHAGSWSGFSRFRYSGRSPSNSGDSITAQQASVKTGHLEDASKNYYTFLRVSQWHATNVSMINREARGRYFHLQFRVTRFYKTNV